MKAIHSHIITTALVLGGLGMWMASASALKREDRFSYDPNPLGLKRSPYGQVVAMAIQTPIDADWHGVLEIHDHPESGSSGHGHGHDHGNDHAHHEDESIPSADCSASKKSDVDNQDSFLTRVEKAVSKRTNSNPPTHGHKLYIRKRIEAKLRFAYSLDPSHYANYGAYNLFITQLSLGTDGLDQEQMREAVFALAHHTIRYCLKEETDPRPALTAASAAHSVLERMMLADPGTYSVEELEHQLTVMDFCLKRHFELLDTYVENGNWNLISPVRQDEILTRNRFCLKLRDASEKAIERITNEQQTTVKR